MSIYWVATWSVRSEAIREHDGQALPALLAHIHAKHPRVLSVRTWHVHWGAEPAWPGRIWMEEFADLSSLDALEAEERTAECAEVWSRLHALAVPGTFRTAIWTDPLRESWKRVASS